MNLDMLNPPQKEAVLQTEGPVLIFAGAGSGKTRVLTARTAYLIEQGVKPYHILAITFTNKAAGEMRERIRSQVGFGADEVWAATFHSTCVRILRRYIDRLGYGSQFTIYDSDDQKTLMKEVCRKLDIDTKIHKEKTFLNVISSAKDELIGPEKFAELAIGDYNKKRQAQVYREYQAALQNNNALDFDDLITKTVELLSMDPEVLRTYQERFHYVMVDEYQDTNTAQFALIRLLSGKFRNLCVVGDDDQSIYRFRGANIYNILNFEKHFPDAKIIKLEQNYRSTQSILDAANQVISHNTGRKEKKLWTANGNGESIKFLQLNTEYEEADTVAKDILAKTAGGQYRYRDCAVLYRTNAQSRLFEERFIRENIPYRIVGGINFYSRKEIKDVLGYLRTIENGNDDVAIKRIINTPKRGIGAASIQKVADYAEENGISFYSALCRLDDITSLGAAKKKLQLFTTFLRSLKTKAKQVSVTALLQEILDTTGYVRELELEMSDEADGRIENVNELISKAAAYDQTAESPSLGGFLEEVSLVADIDSVDENSDYVVLMTLHSAKGLEFANVYMAGMEEGLFPSAFYQMADDPEAEIEEERRLAYVGITRAKEHLMLTAARRRMNRGEIKYSTVSRFVKEIPPQFFHDKKKPSETGKSPITSDIAVRSGPGIIPKQSFAGTHTSGGGLEYQVGDRVRHIKFGAGVVMAIVPGGRDYEVTVDFDTAGQRKMFASFGKLKKI